eukprot:TRINITY_DN8424_c0_g1_i2.p1 TRINITY_DN8424_c0_g1~~TRINITY_DN8424_c0_g1_i2.p1  ORF type:complete len:566 (-),score=101.35 TRINITY_DN8424_c0_g1_i2:70-1767(-)
MSTTMLMHNNHAWRDSIAKQLLERNEVQVKPFKDVFQQHNASLAREKALNDRIISLEKEFALTKLENSELKREKSLMKEIGGDSVKSRAQIAELELKLQKQQEELTASYKRSSENAQFLLDLNQKLKTLQDELRNKEDEINMWKTKEKYHEEQSKKLEDQIAEKDVTLKVLRDELGALQVEYVTTEQKAKTLQVEHDRLVERWLQKVQEDASKMNESNELYDRMMAAQHQIEVLQRQLHDQLASSGSQYKPTLLDLGAPAVVKLPSKPRRKLAVHTAEVTTVSYSPSSVQFATGAADKTVRVFDTNGTLKSTLMGSMQGVMSVRFSPNEEYILGASNDNAARLWNVEQGRIKHTLTGHIGKVWAAVFTTDNTKVVTGSHDRTLKIWDLTKGYCTRTLFCHSSCTDVGVSPDGAILLSGHIDHHIRVWDSRTGDMGNELTTLHDGQITSVSVSPNGNFFATSSRDHLTRVVDIRTFETLMTFKDDNYRNGLNHTRSSWSPDSHYVAAGSTNGSIFIWNTSNGKTERVINKNAHTSAVSCCVWSNDGTQFVSTGDKDKLVIIWDPNP